MNRGRNGIGFHQEVRELLDAKGWTVTRASLEAGLIPDALARALRLRAYLIPSNLQRLAIALGEPEAALRWQDETKAAWTPRGKTLWARQSDRREPELCLCKQCFQSFPKTYPEQHYCSRRCANLAKRKWILDNQLKARFTEKLRQTGTTLHAIGLEIGVPLSKLQYWLRFADSRLRAAPLESVAAWLGLSLPAALAMQGGSADDRRRVMALTASAAHFRKLKSSERHRARTRKARRRAGLTMRGRPKSEEHRRAIGAGVKAFHAEGRATNWRENIALVRRSLRGRVQAVLKNLRRSRLGLTSEELEAEAILWLKRPPYEIADPRVARALLRPKREQYRQSDVDWYLVLELRNARAPLTWDAIGERLDREPESLKVAYRHFLGHFA